MKNDYSESDPDHNIEVQLDISFLNFFFLVCHCYHGSIVAGLDSRPSICCQQLLDLFFIANEYLCFSLAQECELRILSCNPYKCHCWNCCETLERYDHDEFSMRCYYSVQVRLCSQTHFIVSFEINDSHVIAFTLRVRDHRGCYRLVTTST